MSEKIIESILKATRLDPRKEFKKIIKFVRIPAMARDEVVDQLVGSWQKSKQNINTF